MVKLNMFHMKQFLVYSTGLMFVCLIGCSGSVQQATSGTVVPSSNKFTLSGTLDDQTANASVSVNMFVILDNDANTKNGYIKQYKIGSSRYSLNFSIQSVTSNTYYVWGWKDVQQNSVLGPVDVYSTPVQVVLDQNKNVGVLGITRQL
jgi:hypothetical protein